MGNECKFCEESEIVFQNELFVIYKVRAPSCLKNHFVIESTRQIANEDELTGREKFWLELTTSSAKSYFEKYLGAQVRDWACAVCLCSPHFHIHVFEPVMFWQSSRDKKSAVNLARERVVQIQHQFAGVEAGL